MTILHTEVTQQLDPEKLRVILLFLLGRAQSGVPGNSVPAQRGELGLLPCIPYPRIALI